MYPCCAPRVLADAVGEAGRLSTLEDDDRVVQKRLGQAVEMFADQGATDEALVVQETEDRDLQLIGKIHELFRV